MKVYKHIFFDLDRTLWDLERNSEETLDDLYKQHSLDKHGVVSFRDFLDRYRTINDEMWKHYLRGDISKDVLRFGRFHKTFLHHGVNNKDLAKKFSEDYSYHAPRKKHLFEGTIDVLRYLQGKYQLHIITNGFEEIQHVKMKHSGLTSYFTHIITSDRAGAQKPSRAIFEFALQEAGAEKPESIMIGDTYEVDIIGAMQAGVDQVYFNCTGDKKGKKCTYEIFELRSLMKFL